VAELYESRRVISHIKQKTLKYTTPKFWLFETQDYQNVEINITVALFLKKIFWKVKAHGFSHKVLGCFLEKTHDFFC
jgi:hypothetical protein